MTLLVDAMDIDDARFRKQKEEVLLSAIVSNGVDNTRSSVLSDSSPAVLIVPSARAAGPLPSRVSAPTGLGCLIDDQPFYSTL